MAELIPDYGDRGSALDQFRRDRVSEPALDMTRKSRRPAERNLPTRTDSIRDRTSTTKSRNRKLVERLSGMTWTYRPSVSARYGAFFSHAFAASGFPLNSALFSASRSAQDAMIAAWQGFPPSQ
jgi:hypothetical protein